MILQALKTYGMMVADNGSNWYISGAPDPRWSDDDLHELSQVKGSDFEVVDTRSLQPGAVVVNAGGDVTLREGQTFARGGSFLDDGTGATSWAATVDYGAGGGLQTLPLAADHSFALGHRYGLAGTYVAAVTVHADNGCSGSRRFLVDVRNVAPRIAAQRSGAARRGIAFKRRIAFTDPGADSWRTVIRWGDGSTSRRPSRPHAQLRDGSHLQARRAVHRDGARERPPRRHRHAALQGAGARLTTESRGRRLSAPACR